MTDCFSKSEVTDFLNYMKLPDGTPLVPASMVDYLESTRYCNYIKDDFGSEITVIQPSYLEEGTRAFASWRGACETAERSYFTLLDWGCTPQEARAVLPNSLKTEVIMTANIREWRHFFKLRSAKAAHPQMRELVIPLLLELKANIPIVFDDIPVA